MNIINKTKNSILKVVNTLRKNRFYTKALIHELIVLNLDIEDILFDRKNSLGNPLKISYEKLKFFLQKIRILKKLNSHLDKSKLNLVKFKREKHHQDLFQKLWVNYSFKEYKKERIGRYIKRIRINNLSKKIKGKKIIDFGCGHGNFLISCNLIGAKYCLGIDYGRESIVFAKNILKKLKINNKEINFYQKSVYNSGQKKNSFDFAIQNGVFHHLDNEIRAYKEVHRVLKPDGYFWLYTDGGGGIRDVVADMSHKILRNIDKKTIVNEIQNYGLSTNKQYHLGDMFGAEYRHTTVKEITKKLKKIGFKNFVQLNGGFKTDLDKPFVRDKFFNAKFGSGDIRLLCQKN